MLRASAADGRLTAHLKRAQRIAVNDPDFPQADYRPYGTEKPTDHDQDVFSDAHALPAGADLKEWDNDEDVSVDYYYALNNFQFRVTGESVIVDGEEQTVYDVEVAKRYNFAANRGEHPRNDFRAPIRAVTLRWASGRRSRSTSWPSRRRHGGRGSR